MKGLLVKDLKIIKLQAIFLMLVIVISVGMLLTSKDITFPIGFSCLVMTMLAITTISYDEFDNGYPFLFTLPVSRKQYVISKYLLGIILGFIAWITMTFLSIFITGSNFENLERYLAFLPLIVLLLAITLPFQFKFGGELGRIALVVLFVAITLIGKIFAIDMLASLKIDLNQSLTMVLIYLFALLCLVISIAISIRIMNKKAF